MPIFKGSCATITCSTDTASTTDSTVYLISATSGNSNGGYVQIWDSQIWDSTDSAWTTGGTVSNGWPGNWEIEPQPIGSISPIGVLLPNSRDIEGSPAMSEEEVRQYQERRRVEIQQQENQRLVAAEKGKLLLRDVIGDVLWQKLERQGHVDLPSVKHAGLRYRLRLRHQIGIVRIVNGKWREVNEHLCVHPTQKHVAGDETAVHAILCMYDEAMLWKMANHHWFGVVSGLPESPARAA